MGVRLSSLSARLRGPHEIVAGFADRARAEVALAKLTVFLRWALGTEERPPLPVALLVEALGLDLDEVRPRSSDWTEPPAPRLEGGRTIVLDAPRSAHATEVIVRILRSEGAREVADRKKPGARRPLLAAIVIAAALAAAAFGAWLFVRKLA